MKINLLRIFIFCMVYLNTPVLHAQKVNTNGGILLKAQITLGNQNQWLKLGIFGFGTLNYGDLSLESGISIASYQFLKRHTLPVAGLAYSYDFFALAGLGKNSNLLGSSVSGMNSTLIFNPKGQGGFNGLGFGVSKDVLPKTLKTYGLRRGAFMMRFSNANHNIHLAFHNDFKIGWFKGSGTDYGVTGTLDIGFTQIQDIRTIYQLGLGLDLFTAKPDYSKSPRNPINSDDGRKNVWFTLPPYKHLFYTNLYTYGTFQKEEYALHAKLGINSQKAGAYIQNKLHDGLGLNPRFPWQVDTSNKPYLEIGANAFLKEIKDD